MKYFNITVTYQNKTKENLARFREGTQELPIIVRGLAKDSKIEIDLGSRVVDISTLNGAVRYSGIEQIDSKRYAVTFRTDSKEPQIPYVFIEPRRPNKSRITLMIFGKAPN
ncbi:MAG: hypothetical protein AABX11_00885 [Nanoarchaeota archaeon]